MSIALSGEAGILYTSATLEHDDTYGTMESDGHADYSFASSFEPTPYVSVHHWIDGSTASASGGDYGHWYSHLRTTAFYNTCYRANIDATESNNNTSQHAGTSQYCLGPPPPPQCKLDINTGAGGSVSSNVSNGVPVDCGTTAQVTAAPFEGYSFSGWTGAVTSTSPSVSLVLDSDKSITAAFQPNPAPKEDPPPPGPVAGCETSDCTGGSAWNPEPLVLDLNGDGVNTTGVNDLVWFDIDGDGTKDHITWTNPYTVEGFLWINLNTKNRVDNGSELFGIGYVMPDGSKARDGFEALAVYDRRDHGGNEDGMLDADDRVWTELRVWVDSNHNGVCEQSEVSPLARYGVERISLAAIRTDVVDAQGNGHYLRSHYWRRIKGDVQVFDIDSLYFQARR